MQYPLCFPVVYHGLIAGHTRQTQLEAVNRLLRGDYNDDDYGNGYSGNLQKEEISNYLKGKAVVPLAKVEGIDEEDFVDKLKERLTELKLDTDIEFVVSAFHTLFLTKRSRLDKAEIEHFDNIIFVDNDPKKYIAEAIALSLRYSAKTDSVMTKEFTEELHNLHLQEGVQNLFRLTKNERVHYLVKRGIPEEITEKSLREIWETVIRAEIAAPGTVSARLYNALEDMSAQGARAVKLVAPLLMFVTPVQQMVLNNHHRVLIDGEKIDYDPLRAWLDDPEVIISLLQECGLVRTVPRKIGDETTIGDALFFGCERDITIHMRLKDREDKHFSISVYDLTQAGDELFDILNIASDENMVLLTAWTLNKAYGEKAEFSVRRRRVYDSDVDETTGEKIVFRSYEGGEENLLDNFDMPQMVDDYFAKRKENNAYIRWRLTAEELDKITEEMKNSQEDGSGV